MPRHPAQDLRKVSEGAKREVAMLEALAERPLIARVYGDGVTLASLRQRLTATEQWASRLDVAVPTRLMVAATIELPAIAAILDDLALACREAAPPATDVPPSTDYEVWKVKPASNAARADRLIHAISLLGEHVAGCWSSVPSRNPVRADGDVEEDVEWELEYSPPPTNLVEVIGSNGVLASATLEESMLEDRHVADSPRIHREVLRLTGDAVDELQQKAFATGGRFGTQAIRTALGPEHQDLLRLHDDLMASVSDIQVASRDAGGSPRGGWASLHDRLVTGFDAWIDQVLPAIPLDRHRRQAVKRDLPRTVGYVAQYALLLRGNAASLELLRMVGYLKQACRVLGDVIDAMLGGVKPAAGGHATRVRLDSLLVSRDIEERWRQALGARAEGAGRLIAEVVGETGQQRPVPQRELLRIADEAGLLTAQAQSSRAAWIEALLLQMQLCGLAVKIPVGVFRESAGNGRGATPRRQQHVAREWWLNPLGVVLSGQPR
jgi:hypothetical protein